MKKENKKKNSSALIAVIFVAVIVSFLSENMPEVRRFMSRNVNTNVLAVLIAVIVFSALIIFAISRAAKKKRELPAAVRAREHEMKERADSAAAIRCTCAKGRQRYLDQADMFLKNGLIGKSEWRAMRERYMKMDIPEDM